jgi:hypothetical protein
VRADNLLQRLIDRRSGYFSPIGLDHSHRHL